MKSVNVARNLYDFRSPTLPLARGHINPSTIIAALHFLTANAELGKLYDSVISASEPVLMTGVVVWEMLLHCIQTS